MRRLTRLSSAMGVMGVLTLAGATTAYAQARPAAPPPPTRPAPAPARPAPAPARPAVITPVSDEGFTVGYLDVGPVIGFGGISGAGVGFGGRFEKAFKELPNLRNGVLGLGVSVDYFSFGQTFLGISGYSYKDIPIAVTVNYHLRLDNMKIDPFFGAGLGYQHFGVSGPSCFFAGVDYCTASYNSGVYFVGHAGIRYFWMPKLALYADVGSGAGSLHVGVMYKLSGRQ